MTRFGESERFHQPAQPLHSPSPPASSGSVGHFNGSIEPPAERFADDDLASGQHRIVVTVRDDVDIDDPSTVAQLLDSGLLVDHASSFLGIINGRASEESVDLLRALDIVVAVEEDGEPSVWLNGDQPRG